MNTFNKKKDKQLIDLVQNYPVLYDPGNSNFKNCIVKHKVWESISATMEISIPELKRRWKHFRDHFHKKLKAERDGLTTFHTWEYKPHLNFLTQYCSYKKDKLETVADSAEDLVEDLKETHETEIGPGMSERMIDFDVPVQSVLGERELDLESDEVMPKKKRRKIDTLAAVLESRLAERFRVETTKAEKSPIHKFFDSMADIVCEFPPHLAAEARLKVCQIINELECKKHNEQEYMPC